MLPAALRLLVLNFAGLGILSLSACAPATTTGVTEPALVGEPTPRPAGSPDVLLISISGRCPMNCQAPADNIDYLTPRGTVQAVASTLQAQGLSVQTYAAAGNLTEHTPRTVIQGQVGVGKTVAARQDGFLQAEEHLRAAYADWMRGRSNPTRIVLLAHSHGVVWSHALARAHPEAQIAAMIDLDGVCDFWETDNRRAIQSYVRQLGHNPWSFDLSDSCSSVRVGHIRYDLKDVVFANVQNDLEVQSSRLLSRADGSFVANLPFDALGNIRSDGTRTGIQTFRSSGETHSSVSRPDSRAMAWVRAQLNILSAGWAPTRAPVPPAL